MDLRRDVYFYADFSSFPTSGSSDLLYVDVSTGFIYSWNGSSYVASGGGGLNYLGLWDADTNTPTITSSIGNVSDYYIVSVAGTTTIDGISSWAVGDWIVFSSTGVWEKINIPNQQVGSLQEVTDEGNTTTNNIQLLNSAEVIFGAGGGILLDNSSRLREGTIDAGTGGGKGIAQICGVGYELKWEAGSQYVMNSTGTLIREVNHAFYAPTATDDDTKGFYIGSRFVLENGTTYVCTDATSGAAVWALITFINTGDNIYGIGNDSTLNNIGYQVVGIGQNTAIENIGDQVVGIGQNAAYQNVGSYVCGIGYYAAGNNIGSNVVGVGDSCSYLNTGGWVVGIGNSSAQQNTGNYVVGVGYLSAFQNTGNDVVASGQNAAYQNSGDYLVAIGSNAGKNNTSFNNNAIGKNAGELNSGGYCNAIGAEALKENIGSDVIGIGTQAAQNNEGNFVSAIGNGSAKLNEGNNVVSCGNNSANSNLGNNVIALGESAGIANQFSNSFIIGNNELPSYADFTAASTAITVALGASAGCTYIYHDQSTNSIGAVRL